ncbi:RND family transporter [Acuticoccus sp. I52.16.1]|uniref:efflux RND transporter permease subunit n=1 Tax=Acuticoccus sp. I52.16.1 TaxID=2928472 RepID=UPI001FD62BE9|nr:MMPL family transporter [Acuticoccus sp. I52.16.1]UOM33706.1 MMPL family transporter [Acuticoccus sp. I52.16.1]
MPRPPRTDWEIYAQVVHRLRFVILALGAIAIGVTLPASERVTYDTDVLTYFEADTPSRDAFEAIEARFGRSVEVVTLVVPRDGTVFTPQGVAAIARLAEASAARPEVSAVRSPLPPPPPPHAPASDDAPPSTWAERFAAAADAPENRPLVAADGSVAAVAAVVDARAAEADVRAIAAAHRALRDAVAADAPGFELIQTGRIPIDDAYLRESRDDVDRYAGLQMGILAALIFVAVGSLSMTLAIMVVVVALTGGSVGVLALTGTPLNGLSSAAPAVLMGLMVASVLHIALAYQGAIRGGATRQAAIALAYARNARPVVLSVATTMVSFLLLNVAESPPFRQLGTVVAVGLVGVLALAFTLLPALLAVLPRNAARHRAGAERAIGALAGASARHARVVLVAAGLVAAVAGAGAGRLVANDTFAHYFDARYEVRRATDLFEAKLSGTTIVDIEVDAGAPEGVFAGPVRSAGRDLTAWLQARPEVARVDSIAALLATAPAPGTPAKAAVTAATDRLAATGGPRLLGPAARYERLSVVLAGVSSQDILAFQRATEAQAARLYGAGAVRVSGLPVLSAELSVNSARSMILGMALALAAISGLLMVTLRSVRLGLVSLVPNLLPILLAFGAWGFAVREVSFAATVVGALTYGIVVDDTVHILAGLERARDTRPPREALEATYRRVGVAVVVTTLALALSFMPFAVSGFLVNRHFGILTALTLAAALLADLVVLPALMAVVDRERPRRRRR